MKFDIKGLFKNKSKNNINIISIIGMIIGLIIGIFSSYLLNNILFVPLSIIIFLTASTTLFPNYISSKKAKIKKNDLAVQLAFYHSYIIYSNMESSFIDGFKKTIDSMPISEMKDKLKEFCENNMQGNFPLRISDSRRGNVLNDLMISEITSSNDYSKEALEKFKDELKKYESEEKASDNSNNLYYLPVALLFLYSIALLICFIQ